MHADQQADTAGSPASEKRNPSSRQSGERHQYCRRRSERSRAIPIARADTAHERKDQGAQTGRPEQPVDGSDSAGRQSPVNEKADADGNADQHREREQRKRQGEHQNIRSRASDNVATFALCQKLTLAWGLSYIRFTPKSGHVSALGLMSAKCH